MSMFDSYDNLNPRRIPNNISNNPPKEYNIIDTTIPKKMYNVKNEFIGYTWEYGTEFDFIISVNDLIKVKRDSVVYNEIGEEPTTATVGYKGQQCYNTVDNKSWTCVGIIDGFYVWVPDEKVTYAKDGTTTIEMQEDMTARSIRVEIYDFRRELLKSFENSGCNSICCRMDKDIYEVMKSGVHYVTVKILGLEEVEIKQNFEILITDGSVEDGTL